jgi:hypothetical protein
MGTSRRSRSSLLDLIWLTVDELAWYIAIALAVALIALAVVLGIRTA